MPVILTPRQRAKIREGLREAVSGKSASERAAVEKLIGNRRLFNAFIRSAGEAHAETKGGPVTDFIDFILSRADQLIAFVKAIMALFGALLLMLIISGSLFAADRNEESRYAYGHRLVRDQVTGERLTADLQMRYFTIDGGIDIQEQEWRLNEKYSNGNPVEMRIGQWVWRFTNGDIVVNDGELPSDTKADFYGEAHEDRVLGASPKKVAFTQPRVECSNGQCRLVPSVESAGNCANGQCRVSARPQRRGWIRFFFGR